jgi:hypothetical protein
MLGTESPANGTPPALGDEHHRPRRAFPSAANRLRPRADDGSVVNRSWHGSRLASSRPFIFPRRIGDAKEMDDAAANA